MKILELKESIMFSNQEKLSWKDITEKYPDEWVLLIDYEPDIEYDGRGVIATKGKVIAHAKARKEFNEIVKNTKVEDAAITYTGNLVPEGFRSLWRPRMQ